MANVSIRLLACVLGTAGVLATAACMAQEKPQKGVGVGALERRSQQHTGGQDMVSVQQQLKRRDDARSVLSEQQLTDLFLRFDHDADLRLSRSEVTKLPTLRARFASYDLDGDHRLDYSEFAAYADTLPADLAQSTH